MSWFKEIFNGSVNRRVSRGHYDGDWHEGHSSDHIRDTYDDSDNEDIDRAIALSLAEAEEDQNKGKAAAIDTNYNLEEDEQLARAVQESLNAESPPRRNVPIEDEPVPPQWDVPVERVPPRQYVPENVPPSHIFPRIGSRICAGCQNPIGHGRFLSCMDSVWHPQCFRCFACNKPISEYEFAMHDDQPYHKSCYKEFFHPKCDVCNNFIPTNRDGLIEYRAHPFWMQKYCPSHEDDGTPRCCSCERMEVSTGFCICQ